MRLETLDGRCTGCHICENFCSFHHEGAIWPERARIAILLAGGQSDSGPFVVNICRQCDDAPCAAACPTGAITLRSTASAVDPCTGAWVVDARVCAACGDCVEACAYGAIRVDEDLGVALKCDLCAGEPECAAMCPTGAVLWSMTIPGAQPRGTASCAVVRMQG